MNNILEAVKIVKIYEDETEPVLKKINLSVDEGEFLAVMGRSGSGKSTLLYNISGMDSLTQGSIKFSGTELMSMKEDEISKMRLEYMGFIFQHSYLLKTLSVRDNILLPAMKLKKESKKDIIKKADTLMKRLDISEIGNHDITKISGGQLQRAAVCRALMNSPKIIYADEPTGALNSSAAAEVMDILCSINHEGTTILLVTHDANVAARADRVIFLSDGRIQSELRLGKFKDTREVEERNKKMVKWLKEQGF